MMLNKGWIPTIIPITDYGIPLSFAIGGKIGAITSSPTKKLEHKRILSKKLNLILNFYLLLLA